MALRFEEGKPVIFKPDNALYMRSPSFRQRLSGEPHQTLYLIYFTPSPYMRTPEFHKILHKVGLQLGIHPAAQIVSLRF